MAVRLIVGLMLVLMLAVSPAAMAANGPAWNPANWFASGDDSREQVQAAEREAEAARKRAEEAREAAVRARKEAEEAEERARRVAEKAAPAQATPATAAKPVPAPKADATGDKPAAWNPMGWFGTGSDEPVAAVAAEDTKPAKTLRPAAPKQTGARVQTEKGDIVFEFYADEAPITVENFVKLVKQGFYNQGNMKFHRVVPGFVIQGGHLPTRRDPLEPRQQAFVRPLAPEFNDTLHDRGIISMARGAEADSATSSFFIVLAPTPGLDGQYTVFGRVAAGMDVVEKIEGTMLNGETPVTRIEVFRVRVERAG